MCKKLTKLVKDSDAMKEELAKYRSLYGDVNVSLTVEEVRRGKGIWCCVCMRALKRPNHTDTCGQKVVGGGIDFIYRT